MPESTLPIPWQLVESRLPAFLQSTNHPQHGVVVRPRESALGFSHIQLDARSFRSALLFDVDDSSYGYTWDDKLLPEPSWIAVNPKNGHSHIAYVLDRPVVRFEEKHARPIQFFNVVKRGIQLQLGSDPAYNGSLTKNPRSPQWHTRFSNRVYALSELYEWLRPDVLKLASFSVLRQDEAFHEGLLAAAFGRNDYVFNATRRDAYSNWDELAKLDIKRRLAWLQEIAFAHNRSHGYAPLTDGEVRQIAKSINRFISNTYDPAKGSEGLPQRQRHRQRVKAERQRQSTEARLRLAVLVAASFSSRITISAVSNVAHISRQAMYSYHQWAVAKIKNLNSQSGNTHRYQQLRVFDSYYITTPANHFINARITQELVMNAQNWLVIEGGSVSASEWLKLRCFMAHNRDARPRLGRTI